MWNGDWILYLPHSIGDWFKSKCKTKLFHWLPNSEISIIVNESKQSRDNVRNKLQSFVSSKAGSVVTTNCLIVLYFQLSHSIIHQSSVYSSRTLRSQASVRVDLCIARQDLTPDRGGLGLRMLSTAGILLTRGHGPPVVRSCWVLLACSAPLFRFT